MDRKSQAEACATNASARAQPPVGEGAGLKLYAGNVAVLLLYCLLLALSSGPPRSR